MSDISQEIASLTDSRRVHTFQRAAEFILQHRGIIIETGCHRGMPASDGNGTLILAQLAKLSGVEFHSFEIDPEHVRLAENWLADNGVSAEFHLGDSVQNLSRFQKEVKLAYLDSYDYWPENPGPCQRHQMAELGAIYGKLIPPCAILMDDNVPGTGGKCLLTEAFLIERGWEKIGDGYQILYSLTR
jgi:hypothetical protein